MKLTVYDSTGKEVESIDADDAVFGLAPHKAAMRQALLAQLAHRRAGSAKTKTRGEVRGSTIKTRRQKGTGASRQGSVRAPHHRHGGISFGPSLAPTSRPCRRWCAAWQSAPPSPPRSATAS